jgi:hypothetical protein
VLHIPKSQTTSLHQSTTSHRTSLHLPQAPKFSRHRSSRDIIAASNATQHSAFRTHQFALPNPHKPKLDTHTHQHVFLRNGRPPPNLFRAKDRTGRGRNRHGFRHVQPVRTPITPTPISCPIYPYCTLSPARIQVLGRIRERSLTRSQSPQILHLKMHRHILPRSRSQQGRIRLPRPLCGQVLRGECQG